MIIRVFTAKVPLELHLEFEEKFMSISAPLVKGQKGLLGLDIAKPAKWNPKTFLVISKWATQDDIIKFAGEKWNEAHIPEGMEKYIEECSVTHFVHLPL